MMVGYRRRYRSATSIESRSNTGEVHLITQDDFRTQFGYAAETFQFLEEVLKTYLILCFAIVRRRVPPEIRFNYTEKDVQNMPLGNLARAFSKYNPNTALYEKIRDLTKKRNYIAHEAYITLLGRKDDQDHLSDQITKVQEIREEARVVFGQVVDEVDKLQKIKL